MIRNVEFYNTPDGAVMVKKQGEAARELLPDDRELVSDILELISKAFPSSIGALEKLYAKSKPNRQFFEFRVVDRFCRCNWGKYDLMTLDIDENGKLNLEEVDCPMRCTGDCPFCGIICKPQKNTVLTEREIQISRLVSKGLTNSDIAELLSISILTVISHRNNIRAKIGANNTAQMIQQLKDIL